jgi:hypothetical protein
MNDLLQEVLKRYGATLIIKKLSLTCDEFFDICNEKIELADFEIEQLKQLLKKKE